MPMSAFLYLDLPLAPQHRSRACLTLRGTQVTQAQLHGKDFGRRVITRLRRTPQILKLFLKVKYQTLKGS